MKARDRVYDNQGEGIDLCTWKWLEFLNINCMYNTGERSKREKIG